MLYDRVENMLKNETVFEYEDLRRKAEEYFELKKDVDLKKELVSELETIRWDLIDKRYIETDKITNKFFKFLPIIFLISCLPAVIGGIGWLGTIISLVSLGNVGFKMYKIDIEFSEKISKIEGELEDSIREYVNKNEFLFKLAESLHSECISVLPNDYMYVGLTVPFSYISEMELVNEIRQNREREQNREEFIGKVKKRIRIKGKNKKMI